MDLLVRMGSEENPPRRLRDRALTLLASFLNDREGNDDISVQNIASECEMAVYLNIDVPFKFDRSEKEWSALRAKVAKAWKLEQARTKAPPSPTQCGPSLLDTRGGDQ